MLKTSTSLSPRATTHRVPARCWCARRRRVASAAFFLIFAFCRFAPCALANDNSEPTGRLEGTVFVVDQGHQTSTSGAKVQASGPVHIETETNADGKYVFVALPPGTYSVEVTSSGLEATETIVVHANQVVTVTLQLRPARVDTS